MRQASHLPERLRTTPKRISSIPDVMGGDACIENTRIPVWLLVQYRQMGMPDGEILRNYPALTASDLTAAWEYFAERPEEIARQMREHEEAE